MTTVEIATSFFRNTLCITEQDILQDLCTVVRIEHFKKGDLLLEIGEHQKRLYFLLKGFLRGFTVEENGHDITDFLAFRQGTLIMGSKDSISGISQVNIEALNDCVLLSMPSSEIEQFLHRYPSLLWGFTEYLQASMAQQWEIKHILYQPAMQRYLWFLEAYPGLIDSVCNKHIASFLGITPVTLSRLRRQLKEEKLNDGTDM